MVLQRLSRLLPGVRRAENEAVGGRAVARVVVMEAAVRVVAKVVVVKVVARAAVARAAVARAAAWAAARVEAMAAAATAAEGRGRRRGRPVSSYRQGYRQSAGADIEFVIGRRNVCRDVFQARYPISDSTLLRLCNAKREEWDSCYSFDPPLRELEICGGPSS